MKTLSISTIMVQGENKMEHLVEVFEGILPYIVGYIGIQLLIIVLFLIVFGWFFLKTARYIFKTFDSIQEDLDRWPY